MSDMADVLRTHTRRPGTRDLAIHCECGWSESILSMRSSKGSFAAHQATALSAAGFGPVKEAVVGAVSGALEDAADRVMGPSDVLLDGATCRWIAMELRESAQALRATL